MQIIPPFFSSSWPRKPRLLEDVLAAVLCASRTAVCRAARAAALKLLKWQGESIAARDSSRRWPLRKGVRPHSCHFVCLCRDMQPHMAGTLQSKGRDDLGIFSTQTPLMILVFIKCSKSSRPSFSSSWPRKPSAPVRVKNRCLQSCEAAALKLLKWQGESIEKLAG